MWHLHPDLLPRSRVLLGSRPTEEMNKELWRCQTTEDMGDPPAGSAGWVWGSDVMWEGVKRARPKGPVEIGLRNNLGLKRKQQTGILTGI